MPDADLSAVRLLPADHGRRARAPRYVGHAVVVTDEAVSDDRLIVREARERPEGRNCQCGRMPSGLRHEPSYLNEADAPDLPVQLADQLAHLGIEGVSWGNPSPLNQQHAEFSGGDRGFESRPLRQSRPVSSLQVPEVYKPLKAGGF